MNLQTKGAIRIAHLSDLHYSPENLAEVGRCFASGVDDAIEAKVDVAIITGDSTDYKQDAHSPALHALMREVQRLLNHCPVLMLQGTFSHEPAGMLQLFRFIGGKYPIEVVDRIGQVGLFGNEWRPVQSERDCVGARLVISCVPTVNKADLVASVGAEHVAEAMGDVLAGLMTGVFAPVNRVARSAGIPTVFIGHGTVSGAVTQTGVPMHGLDHEFTVGGIYGSMCTAAMLGHIHRYQVWDRECEGIHQMIAYPSSIGRIHYGDDSEKGFLIWEVGSHHVNHRFVPTPACRMIDFTFEGIPDLDFLRQNAEECRGAYVRVRYEVDAEAGASVDQLAIREILSCALEVQIKGRLLPTQRQRSAGISRLGSLAEKVVRWCEATGNEAQQVVPRVMLLETGDPKAIASAIIERIHREAKAEAPAAT